MPRSIRTGLLLAAATLTLTGSGYAADASDLEARLAKTEAELAQLEGENWMTEQRVDEIRGLVQDVLADADTRASLLQSGMTAGYDNGFIIASGDGNFSIKLNGQLQTRFIYNTQDGDASPDNDVWGFENTRTKLIFSGNVAGQAWRYYIEGDFGREGNNAGVFGLEHAWISYKCGNGWLWYAGQMKFPFLREWLVHSQNQLLVERSHVSYFNSGSGFTQGAAIDFRNEWFHFTAAVTDGYNTANTTWNTRDNEFAITGRFEFLLDGDWDQFVDFTSPQGSDTAIMLGVAGHWEKAEYGTTHNNEIETTALTADVSFEFDGANLFAAVMYTNYDNDASVDNDRIGFVLQGGFYFTEDFEAFARYEFTDFDSSVADDLSLITIGFNKYWGDHVTWTTDLGYSLNTIPSAYSIAGWRSDVGDEDGQIVLRSQLQLTF